MSREMKNTYKSLINYLSDFFFQEISQQLMLERRAKKKSMNSYNKMADVENKKGVFSKLCTLEV